MGFSVYQPPIVINISFITFPPLKKLIGWDNIYNFIFLYSMFRHKALSSLIPAVKAEITSRTDFGVIGTAVEILPHDLLDRIIKCRHCTFHSRFCVRIGNRRHTAVFAGIVNVHFADLLSGALLHKMGIDMKLPTISLELFAVFLHVGFALGFKVYNFNCISFAANQINFALNNAIRRSRTKRLTDEKGHTRSFGIQQAQNVWGRKMRCRCGSPMLRHRWRTNNAGKPIYGYECKRHHDTPRIRLQNEQGNPTPICEIKPVGQSKLELMASKIFERVWGDQREIVLQTCKMLDACYKPDADRRADLMKAKDDSIQLLQQQLDDLVVVRARGEIEQDKFLQRTIEIQQQMEALRQSKAQIASEDYNPGRLDMEAIEAALCEAVEMHDGLVSEDFIDLFVSQVTPLSDSRFAWCLDFSPQPTVAFLNLAGQRKYTTCSMDSKLHFGPFADEEGHTIPFPGSLRR